MKKQSDTADVIASQCIAVRLRLLNRVVTRLYDGALRPLGLRVSQMGVLAAASRLGEAKPGDVCRVLQMDKSTLSRDVERLRARGWLEATPGDDGRTHTLRVTPAGTALLERALPAWREAQRQAADLLGKEAVAAVAGVVDRLWKTSARV